MLDDVLDRLLLSHTVARRVYGTTLSVHKIYKASVHCWVPNWCPASVDG